MSTATQHVLLVEDDPLISADVEHALNAAGYHVCGVATSEFEALRMGGEFHPDFAVLDVNLDPGDGRNVARELSRRYNTKILMATAENPATLNQIGATAVLPKPYNANLVPSALVAVDALSRDVDAGDLPDHMRKLY